MKKVALWMILVTLVLNTRIYVEDWNIVSHFDTNEVCVSLFDKLCCMPLKKIIQTF